MLTYILSISACLCIALPLFIWIQTRILGEDVKRVTVIFIILLSFIPIVNYVIAFCTVLAGTVFFVIELASKNNKIWFKAKKVSNYVHK
jgi:hypothetical protein